MADQQQIPPDQPTELPQEHSGEQLESEATDPPSKKPISPTFRFFLRGLAISLPPVLTLVILIWVAQGIYTYAIHPVSRTVQYSLAAFIEDIQPRDQFVSWEHLPSLEYCGQDYLITRELRDQFEEDYAMLQARPNFPQRVPRNWLMTQQESIVVPFGDQAVPYQDYAQVAATTRPEHMPGTAMGIYQELVTIRYFKSLFHLSAVAILVTIVLLYFLGRLVTVRMGAWAVNKFETQFFGRLPLVSNVYSSVKQVTDFLFTERTVEYNRVVAFEYPRRGIWTMGFVTSDSLLEITASSGQPMLCILVPTSPMPMTGFTVHVPRNEVLDLNITIDQTFQFCLSCGVLIPPQQKVTPERLQQELSRRLTGAYPTGAIIPGSPGSLGYPQGQVLPTQETSSFPTNHTPTSSPPHRNS